MHIAWSAERVVQRATSSRECWVGDDHHPSPRSLGGHLDRRPVKVVVAEYDAGTISALVLYVKYYIADYQLYCYRWPRNEGVFGLVPPASPSARG